MSCWLNHGDMLHDLRPLWIDVSVNSTDICLLVRLALNSIDFHSLSVANTADLM